MSYSEVLRIPAFRNLWLGQAVSQLGDAFYYVTFMFMVKKITNDNAMVGYVGAADTLPYLLFSVAAGALADRIDRRLIMLVGDLLCGVSLLLFAALVWFNPTPPTAAIFGIAFFLSTVRACFFPAKNASIPALVSPKQLMAANALSMTTQNVMPLISMSLSASVMAILYDRSPQLFFFLTVLINALSFFVSAVFVARLPAILPERAAGESRAWQDMKDGLSYMRKRRVLLVLLGLQTAFSLLVAPFFVVYVAANEAWFGGRPSTLAWFEFAFFLAMVGASAMVGRMSIRRPGQGFIWGLALVGGCVVVMAFTPWFWPFLILQFVCGIGVPFADIPMGTYIQGSTPDAFRGRVNAVMNMLRVGVMPLGYFFGGLLVEKAGLEMAFIVMGGGMMLATLVGLLDREFRNLSWQPSNPEPTPAG